MLREQLKVLYFIKCILSTVTEFKSFALQCTLDMGNFHYCSKLMNQWHRHGQTKPSKSPFVLSLYVRTWILRGKEAPRGWARSWELATSRTRMAPSPAGGCPPARSWWSGPCATCSGWWSCTQRAHFNMTHAIFQCCDDNILRWLHLREAILATPLPRSYERWRKPLRMLMQMKSPLPELWPPL